MLLASPSNLNMQEKSVVIVIIIIIKAVKQRFLSTNIGVGRQF